MVVVSPFSGSFKVVARLADLSFSFEFERIKFHSKIFRYEVRKDVLFGWVSIGHR